MAESSDGKQSSCFHRTSPRARHMPSNDTRPRCRAASEVQALGAGSQPRTPNTLRHPFSYDTREIREAPLARDGAELRVYGGLFGWAAPSTESKSGRCEIQLRTLRVKYGQYPMADRNGTRTASLRSKRRDSMTALPATSISSCCGGRCQPCWRAAAQSPPRSQYCSREFPLETWRSRDCRVGR